MVYVQSTEIIAIGACDLGYWPITEQSGQEEGQHDIQRATGKDLAV